MNRCATGAGRACVPIDGVFSIGPVGLPPFYAAELETLAGKTIPRLHPVFMSGYVRLPAGTALCDASLGDLTGCPVLIPVRSTAVSGCFRSIRISDRIPFPIYLHINGAKTAVRMLFRYLITYNETSYT